MKIREISLVIPAHNEEKRIEKVLIRYCRLLPDQEIIVVCDGCSDSTYDIVKRVSKSFSQIKLINLVNNSGKGYAIIKGITQANNEKIGFVDSDESIEPEDIIIMFECLQDTDCVIASRRHNKSHILAQQPIIRRIASKIFNVIVRIMFNIGIKDTQCGAKVFRKEVIQSILPAMVSKGFEFDAELLWRLRIRGYKIVEFPITWKHSKGSRFTLWKAPGMFFSLLKIRFGRHQP